MTYADIIIDISHEKLDKSFQYLVPSELEEEIRVGMVVSIPFGRGNHVRKGYVVGISDEPKVKGIQLTEFLHFKVGICSGLKKTLLFIALDTGLPIMDLTQWLGSKDNT